MDYTIFPNSKFGATYRLDEVSLNIERPLGSKSIPWSYISGAGLVRGVDVEGTDDVPSQILPPGFDRLEKFAEDRQSVSQQLLVAWRAPRGRKHLEHLIVERQGTERDAFLAELRNRLGQRFLGGEENYSRVRKALGFSNLGVYVLTAIFFVIIFFLLIFYWSACGLA